MMRIISFLLPLLFVFSCTQRQPIASDNNGNSPANTALAQQSLVFYLGLDTIPTLERKQLIESVLAQSDPALAQSPYGAYLKSLLFHHGPHQDSVAFYFNQALEAYPTLDISWQRLITYTQLNQEIKYKRVASLEFMELLYAQLEEVNKTSTALDYQLYDILAKAYFLNRDLSHSLQYTTLYFDKHPFKDTRVIQSRFFDISFLLAAESQDRDQALHALQQLKILLKGSQDEIAKMRYFDMEARYFALAGNFEKALNSSKRYFHYSEKTNQLHPTVYNNLATSFERNRQLDSAIHYYKEGIALAQRMKILEQNQLYGGLSHVYKSKGDYQQALIALDSSFAHATRIKEKVNANKLHELEIQYQTKQKDMEITTLKENFELQQKNFQQQRWITFLVVLFCMGILLYGLILYRQRLLSEKNKRLAVHNKKMELEQRMLQVQLNPHFIYNAIANLQGFINQENKTKANRYLIALSKLMRHILELNRHDFVSLTDELSAVENYLQVQQMRYNDSFEYEIHTGTVDLDELLIPPMLVQPFIENAIEHGFKNLTYRGQLTLTVEVKEEQLYLYIRDNGRGFQHEPSTTHKQSLSQIITQERLDVLFQPKKQRAFFKLYSIENTSSGSGVEVVLCIPILYH